MPKFLGPSYVLPYQVDYDKLREIYERNLMTYIDHLKYREMVDDPDFYFKNKNVTNFNMILNVVLIHLKKYTRV